MNSNIIEISAVRSLIKRSFPNDVRTIVGKLLQNSQRSGATYIDFFTRENRIVVFDNGSGINDFRDLIVLGKSKYTEQVTQNQHPMGVGFHSLLAHDQITSVTVHSAGKSITIDTQRWWQDDDYAENWQSLVRESDMTQGVAFSIETSAEFISAFTDCFVQGKIYKAMSCVQGYKMMGLSIKLNSQDVDTDYPDWVKRANVLLYTRYQENPLIICSSHFGTSANYSLINWYGQLIKVETDLPFGFLYEITEGRPVEPQAPVRNGIIQDQKWQAFIDNLVAEIVKHFAGAVAHPDKYDVEGYYNLRNLYPQIPYCPFFTAEKALGYDEQHDESVELKGKIEVFKYDNYKLANAEKPRLIKDMLLANTNDDRGYEEYEGYESFVPLVSEPLHIPQTFHNELLAERIETFYWRPGKAIETKSIYSNISFYQAGTFSLSKSWEDAIWNDVRKDVFAIAERSACNIDDCEDWMLGCTTTPVDALSEYTLAGYRHADKDCSEYYRDEIQNIIIQIVGKAIRTDPSQSYLKGFVAEFQQVELEQIKNVGVIFGEDSTAIVVAEINSKLIRIEQVQIIEA